MFNGDHILALGVTPGPEVGEALRHARLWEKEGCSQDFIEQEIKLRFVPRVRNLPQTSDKLRMTPGLKAYKTTLDYSEDAAKNYEDVNRNMIEMSRLPVVRDLAVMPDACPAGPGITVGGVIACENAIIPSAHSEDICCSMMTTFFKSNKTVSQLMGALMQSTHFGPGGHPELVNESTPKGFYTNPFLAGLEDVAWKHRGTQGDGNHFASLGRCKGGWTLTTHHGSRGFGAQVYKRGQKAAIKYTAEVAEGIPPYGVWLDTRTEEGRQYWEALKQIRCWTELNHYIIHDKFMNMIAALREDSIFNEHNFVWQEDNIFYHGKGATPARKGQLGIIPLNMAEPILIVKGTGNDYLNFAPHGAGRNESRTAVSARYEHLGDSRGLSVRDASNIVAEQTKGLDVRWFNGKPDITESPLAYKPASYIIDSINKYGLCTIIDQIEPVGCVMAGYSEPYWKRKKKKSDGSNSNSQAAKNTSQKETEGSAYHEQNNSEALVEGANSREAN